MLEYGAGHPRKDFDDERLELARRFREKYSSHHESGEAHRSNVAPHFIGVFDTVAALGAKGMRRAMIQTMLYLGVIGFGAVVAIAPAWLIAGIGAIFWDAFWRIFLAVIAIGAVSGAIALRRKQRGSVRKTIRDYPTLGASRSHIAEWKGDNFDRLLSRFVPYARSANAIDETREDFARVAWGNTSDAPEDVDGHKRFKQWWFAGNHSDIGGSYPEVESRLSDIALQWMIKEAIVVPGGLVIGPVVINGEHLPGTIEEGPSLHLFPSARGVQHCEVAGMKDTIASRVPRWLSGIAANLGYRVKVREINPDAFVDPTVDARFSLASVPQCAGSGAYRPEALRTHKKFAHYYEALPTVDPAKVGAAKVS